MFYSVLFVLSLVVIVTRSAYLLDQYQYKVSRLEDICGDGSKREIRFHYERPQVFTFNSTVTSRFKCHLELEVSTGDGFMVFFDSLQIDEEPRCTKDYVQFGWDVAFVTVGTSDKKCEHFPHLQLSDEGTLTHQYWKENGYDGRVYQKDRREIDLWIELYPQRNVMKEIKLTVTPVQVCNSRMDNSRFARCPNTNTCIAKSLFCDGKINCAKNAQDENLNHCSLDEVGFIGSPIGVPIIIILAVVIPTAVVISGAFFFSLMKRYFEVCRSRSSVEDLDQDLGRAISEERRRRREGRLRDNADSRRHEGAVALSELLVSPPQADRHPSGAGDGEESLPLPSSPPPYSEIYKDDPPKYSEIAPENTDHIQK